MTTIWFRIGSIEDAIGYDDGDYDSAIETDQPIKAGAPIDPNDVLRLGDILGAALSANRLVATDGSGLLVSVADLASWIAGTSNRISISNDGDGTITLSTPQDSHTSASPTYITLTLSGLTASRLMASGGSKETISVADLTAWIAGTVNQITSTSDGDGTLTLSLPQNIHVGASPIFSGLTIGIGTAGVDYTLTFDGEDNDGLITWMEDEDYFQFSDDILLANGEKLYLRDTSIGIYSQADTFLDLFADGEIRFGDSSAGAPTNYIGISSAGDLKPKGSAEIIIRKASGNGIKVDHSAKTFPFRDLLGDVTAKNTGATKPTHTTYRDGLEEYQFAAGKKEFFKFHIPHDHVIGTDLFLHVHWSHIGTLVNGGTITFNAEHSYCKSHNQAAFPASINGDFNGTASTTQYQQILTEVQLSASSPTGFQLDTDDLEPDGLILMTIEMKTNSITVSGGGVPDPFIHYVDIHYQSSNIGTKAKAPDFYS